MFNEFYIYICVCAYKSGESVVKSLPFKQTKKSILPYICKVSSGQKYWLNLK
jgi:hypothetical protein